MPAPADRYRLHLGVTIDPADLPFAHLCHQPTRMAALRTSSLASGRAR